MTKFLQISIFSALLYVTVGLPILQPGVTKCLCYRSDDADVEAYDGIVRRNARALDLEEPGKFVISDKECVYIF